MNRRRDKLVPVTEALADLGGPVKELREASTPTQRHFTLADQVDQLVGANEARGCRFRTI